MLIIINRGVIILKLINNMLLFVLSGTSLFEMSDF